MEKFWYDTDANTIAKATGSTGPNRGPWYTAGTIEDTDNEINNMQNTYYIAGNWTQWELGAAINFHGCLIGFEMP